MIINAGGSGGGGVEYAMYTLGSNKTDVDSSYECERGCWKNADGMVLVRIALKNAVAAGTNQLICTLPAGFIPAKSLFSQIGMASTRGLFSADVYGLDIGTSAGSVKITPVNSIAANSHYFLTLQFMAGEVTE